MLQKKISGGQVSTTVSDRYEVYHVKDVASQNKAIYHHHDSYETHVTLGGETTFYLNGRQFTIKAGNVLPAHSSDLRRIVRQSSGVFRRAHIFITPSFLESRSTLWSNLSACSQPMGEKRGRVSQVEQEVLRQKLSSTDHLPDKKTYGEDVKYEQTLVEYLIFLSQVVQKEESVQGQNAVIPNKCVGQML